jgi:hypothetical protein
LFYKGNAFTVGRLSQNEPRSVNNLNLGNQGAGISEWLQSPLVPRKTVQPGSASKGFANQANAPQPLGYFIKPLLFHSFSNTPTEGNSLLRYLDQGWRVRGDTRKDEVILFARIAAEEGKAEDVSKKELSASRLWLGSLPGSEKPRKDLDGTMAQETYIRVYIPLTNR